MTITRDGNKWIVRKNNVDFYFKTREQARTFRRETKDFHAIWNHSECMEKMAEIIPPKYVRGQVVRVNGYISRARIAPIVEVSMTNTGWGYRLATFPEFYDEQSLSLVPRTQNLMDLYNESDFGYLLGFTKNEFRGPNSRSQYSTIEMLAMSPYLRGIQKAAEQWGLNTTVGMSSFIYRGLDKAAKAAAEFHIGRKYRLQHSSISRFAHRTQTHDAIQEMTGAITFNDYGLKLFRDGLVLKLTADDNGQTLYELGGSI